MGYPIKPNNSLTRLEQRVTDLEDEVLDIQGSDVESVFGRNGVVTAQSGDYNTSQVTESGNLYFTNERVDDRVADLVQNGTGISWTYDDTANTLTGNVSITQYTDELAQDAVGGALTDSSTVDLTYNDGAGTITASVIEAGLTLSNIGGSVTDAQVPDTITLSNITQITTRPHSSLTSLTSGDDHTQYALLAGRSGGQVLYGGPGADTLTLAGSSSTASVVSIDDTLLAPVSGTGGVITPLSTKMATFSPSVSPSALTDTTDGVGIVKSGDVSLAVKNYSSGAEGFFGTRSGGFFVGTVSSNALAFMVNNSEKMTLTAAGNLGINTNSPTSGIDLRNSLSFKQVTDSTTSYTALDTDAIILMTNSAARTVNLPAASTRTGRIYIIVDGAGTATSAPVTLDPNSTELINGGATFDIDRNNASAMIYCDGTGWRVIAAPGTFGGGTMTSVTAGTGLTGGTITTTGTIAIDSTVATLTGSQTLTNKTLTAPVISTISNTGTLTLPTSTDTLVGRATTDTLTNKTLTSPALQGLLDGWIAANETWTYASATTFTIAGVDRTSLFRVGDKIKLTQTTVKYFYVTAVSFSTNTTVTVTGGTDYTLANAAITSPYYSKDATPNGFPDWFSWTPTLSASGSMTWTSTSVGEARFKMTGKLVSFGIQASGTTGGTASNGLIFTLPITVAAQAITDALAMSGRVQDGGSSLASFAFLSGSSTVTARKVDSSNYGLGATRVLAVTGFYEAA